MAKKVMQIDVYEDGTTQILNAIETEAAGKPVEAEKTNWKNFHGYLKKNKEKEAVAESQFSIIVTDPCCWVYAFGNWWQMSG